MFRLAINFDKTSVMLNASEQPAGKATHVLQIMTHGHSFMLFIYGPFHDPSPMSFCLLYKRRIIFSNERITHPIPKRKWTKTGEANPFFGNPTLDRLNVCILLGQMINRD